MENLLKSNDFFPPSLNPKTGRMRTRSKPRWKGLVRMQVEYQQPPLKLTRAKAISIKTAYDTSKKQEKRR